MKIIIIIAFYLALFMPLILSSQISKNYKVLANTSKMTIKGTSNMHGGWEEKVDDLNSKLKIQFQDNKLISIEANDIIVKVKSIKSGNSLMDKLTLKALKSDIYQDIVFTMISNKITLGNKANVYEGMCSGILTISGVTKTIELKYIAILNENKTISISGMQKINMTYYKIDPPTAMFGAMKTGENVDIIYNLLYISE